MFGCCAQQCYSSFVYLYLQAFKALWVFVCSTCFVFSSAHQGRTPLRAVHSLIQLPAFSSVELVCTASSPTVRLSRATLMPFRCSWSTDYHQAFLCSIVPYRVSQQSQPLFVNWCFLASLSASSLAEPCNVGIALTASHNGGRTPSRAPSSKCERMKRRGGHGTPSERCRYRTTPPRMFVFR